MLDNRWCFFQAFDSGALAQWYIFSLSFTDIDLRQAKINQKERDKPCQNHLSRAPYFYTAFLQHHLAPMCKPADNTGNSK